MINNYWLKIKYNPRQNLSIFGKITHFFSQKKQENSNVNLNLIFEFEDGEIIFYLDKELLKKIKKNGLEHNLKLVEKNSLIKNSSKYIKNLLKYIFLRKKKNKIYPQYGIAFITCYQTFEQKKPIKLIRTFISLDGDVINQISIKGLEQLKIQNYEQYHETAKIHYWLINYVFQRIFNPVKKSINGVLFAIAIFPFIIEAAVAKNIIYLIIQWIISMVWPLIIWRMRPLIIRWLMGFTLRNLISRLQKLS